MDRQISKWFLLTIISSSIFLAVIDIFIVNVALPSIRKGINGSDGDIQLVIALYLLGYAAFLITGGRAGDQFGKKKVFLLGMIAFTLASAFCGISQTAFQLNTARMLQGISAGFMIPQGISYIQVLFPDPVERIKAISIYGSIAGMASVIGQFLGGLLPDLHFVVAGWRLIFLINVPLGVASILFAIRFLPKQRNLTTEKFDYSGVLLLTLTLMALIYPMIRGRELGWPAWSLLCIAASIPLLIWFIYDQKQKLRRQQSPLIDMELFAFKDFNIALCAVLFYFMVQDSYFLLNVILLQTGFGISSTEAGLFFVSQGLGFVVASLISIHLVPKYGKKVLQAGILIMIVSSGLHILVFDSVNINRITAYPVLFVYGLGCGSVLPSLMTMALKSIPTKFAGAASGTYATFQQTAIALGIGVIGGLFFYLASETPSIITYLKAYQTAMFVNMFLLVLVGLFLVLLPERKAGAAGINRPQS
ncbi:MFS transporter [Pedobacter sp. HMWF019]|uniref:MFS transporter n=1 Tax=Pedobacter sp. HMWF019 TaxID=2056856 RepID=UPI000D3D5528|nr:MFS transporter [Pedobacter sp. HMWF019]PTS94541.1 MFS transporter [Pedobacter sp. HMWF019]